MLWHALRGPDEVSESNYCSFVTETSCVMIAAVLVRSWDYSCKQHCTATGCNGQLCGFRSAEPLTRGRDSRSSIAHMDSRRFCPRRSQLFAL
jgi:hypothetical protein